jgi:hypothetical protein
MRRFDPRAVGRYECRAWETYHRRKWAPFPNNVPDGARTTMARFYRLLVRSYAALLAAVYR